ncbi:hypothetical protein WJX72_010867 [[Myrmecia] bisecta]|uniref:Amino acid transporter transmembrane domain-containing protein n=1 Tax=[Myrmecia] bisecta TaxID=41462 RepID=A0AAW1PPA0_9CHLO
MADYPAAEAPAAQKYVVTSADVEKAADAPAAGAEPANGLGKEYPPGLGGWLVWGTGGYRWGGHSLYTFQGMKHFLTDGHTVTDAMLTVAMAEIGQVMLVWPHQMYLAGLIPGIILMVGSGLINVYSMYLLIFFFLERKARKIKLGEWWEKDGKRQTVSQYHEVVGFFGGRWVQILAQVLIVISLMGTGIAQVVACSGNMYSIDNSYSKRDYELIFGGVLIVFSLVPTFRHFRWLNIIGIVGTTFAEWYVFAAAVNEGFKPGAFQQNARPKSMQNFFTGLSTLAGASHTIALEMMDAMQDSRGYTGAYFLGYMYHYTLTMPHSIAVNLAWPDKIAVTDNVYGLLPITTIKKVSVWLMIVHQFIAWSLYVTPILFMWEKAIGVHTKPLWIRLPARLPPAFLIVLLGVAFPFYSTINSFFGTITGPFIGFIIPCTLFNIFYWKEANRRDSALQPPKFLAAYGWKPMFVLNVVFTLLYLVSFTGFGIFYNIQKLIQNSKTFGIFPDCYQCPKPKPPSILAKPLGFSPALAPGPAFINNTYVG